MNNEHLDEKLEDSSKEEHKEATNGEKPQYKDICGRIVYGPICGRMEYDGVIGWYFVSDAMENVP